jgi:hypothetical protein
MESTNDEKEFDGFPSSSCLTSKVMRKERLNTTPTKVAGLAAPVCKESRTTKKSFKESAKRRLRFRLKQISVTFT